MEGQKCIHCAEGQAVMRIAVGGAIQHGRVSGCVSLWSIPDSGGARGGVGYKCAIPHTYPAQVCGFAHPGGSSSPRRAWPALNSRAGEFSYWAKSLRGKGLRCVLRGFEVLLVSTRRPPWG